MIGSLLMTVVLAASSGGSAEAMKKYQAKTVTLKVPASWTHSVRENTEKFTSPTGDAFFTLDVSTVQVLGMESEMCLDKILAIMGGPGWERLTIGKKPAARHINVDKANPDGSQKVRSFIYMGCDGTTTWSLIFSGNEEKKDELEAIVTKIAKSIAYTKGK